MRRSLISVLVLGAALSGLPAAEAQVGITIDGIEANREIRGIVSGVPDDKRKDYRVLVYVHTDQWYIHPYAGQGAGKSWAAVGHNGAWRIDTVQRQFKADKVAALLVTAGEGEPAKVENIESVPHAAIAIRDLRGEHTGDFGKL